MLQKVLRSVLALPIKRCYSSKGKNPFTRTWQTLTNEVKTLGRPHLKMDTYPEHADIVIIGGGFIGSSVAYWLKTRAGAGLSVVVLEKDLSFKKGFQNIGLGVLNRHYSLPENIELAQYAAEFLRNSQEYLGQNVDIKYNPHGHLLLASDQYSSILERNATILGEYGYKSELLSPEEIKARYPWIDTTDVCLGCIGSETEGTFSAWEFHKGLVKKSVELGTVYVNGEVIGFDMEAQKDVLIEGIAPGTYKRLNIVKYRTVDQEYEIKFSSCVLAAGSGSNNVAQKADIGLGDALLSINLPLEMKQHNIYCIKNGAKLTGLDTPIITDTSGLWLRRNGTTNDLLCGHVPLLEKKKDLSEDSFYNTIIKPSLWNRFPQSKNLEVSCIAKESYTHTTYDDHGFVGPHPQYTNLFLATGFAVDGCQQAIGVGRGIAELIIDNSYTTTDLTRFTFDRLLIDEPLIESNIY